MTAGCGAYTDAGSWQLGFVPCDDKIIHDAALYIGFG